MNNYFIIVFQLLSENFWFWFNEFKCRDESEFIERKKERVVKILKFLLG